MLAADGYAYLDIDDPVCAWATYRSILVCAPDRPGFVSVWTRGMIRADNHAGMLREFALEDVRASQFPHRISRLRGMFCFLDVESAQYALSWGDHFQSQNLAELCFIDVDNRRDRLDANWITFAPTDLNGYLSDLKWISSYWSGEPYPKATPIWETIVDGSIAVLGTEIRKKAYDNIRNQFPNSLMLLEMSRLAAVVGSDLGRISAYGHYDGDDVVFRYLLDMQDAKNPEFLKKLSDLIDGGHPVNWADMTHHIDHDSFGCVPDLRSENFRRARNQLFGSQS